MDDEDRVRRIGNWLRKHWLLLVLVIYFLISLCYQSGTVFSDRWQTRVKQAPFKFRDVPYTLFVLYPRQVPLAPEGELGRPVVVNWTLANLGQLARWGHLW